MGRGQWEQATLPLAAAAIAPAARPARVPSRRCAVRPTRVTLGSAHNRARGVSQVARALALGAGILWMQPVAAARGTFPLRHASWGGSVCGGVVPPAHDNAVEYARCDLACKHASVQHHAYSIMLPIMATEALRLAPWGVSQCGPLQTCLATAQHFVRQ